MKRGCSVSNSRAWSCSLITAVLMDNAASAAKEKVNPAVVQAGQRMQRLTKTLKTIRTLAPFTTLLALSFYFETGLETICSRSTLMAFYLKRIDEKFPGLVHK